MSSRAEKERLGKKTLKSWAGQERICRNDLARRTQQEGVGNKNLKSWTGQEKNAKKPVGKKNLTSWAGQEGLGKMGMAGQGNGKN